MAGSKQMSRTEGASSSRKRKADEAGMDVLPRAGTSRAPLIDISTNVPGGDLSHLSTIKPQAARATKEADLIKCQTELIEELRTALTDRTNESTAANERAERYKTELRAVAQLSTGSGAELAASHEKVANLTHELDSAKRKLARKADELRSSHAQIRAADRLLGANQRQIHELEETEASLRGKVFARLDAALVTEQHLRRLQQMRQDHSAVEAALLEEALNANE